MSTFNGKVKSVKFSSSDGTSNYLIIVEIEDTAHQINKVTVDLSIKANPDPAPCTHSGDAPGYCIFQGNTKTANPISGSTTPVVVRLYNASGVLLLTESVVAIVGTTGLV